jgi:hypothetical protein
VRAGPRRGAVGVTMNWTSRTTPFELNATETSVFQRSE